MPRFHLLLSTSLLAILCFLGSSFQAPVDAEQVAGPDAPAAQQTTASAEPLRVLVISTQPFFYRDEAGDLTGLEYALLQDFAASRGREMQIVWEENFAELLPRLDAGEADIAVAALTITPERERLFDFSSPYFPVLALVIQRDGEEVATLEELAGKEVLVVPGTSHDDALSAIKGIRRLPDEGDASMFPRLAGGEADALTTDSPAYFWYAEKYPNLVPAFSFGERSYYGFALRSGDPLREDLDAYLREIKNDGRFRAFLHDAFGQWGAEAIDEMADGMFDAER